MSPLTEQLRPMHGLVNWPPTTAGSGVGLKLYSILSSLLRTHVSVDSEVEGLWLRVGTVVIYFVQTKLD